MSATQLDACCTSCLTGADPIISTASAVMRAAKSVISRCAHSGAPFALGLRKVCLQRLSPVSSDAVTWEGNALYVNPPKFRNHADVCLEVVKACAAMVKHSMVKNLICLCHRQEELMGLVPGSMALCACYRRSFFRLRAWSPEGPLSSLPSC